MPPIARPIFQGAPLLCTGFERLTVGTATAGTSFGSVPANGSADAILMRAEAADLRYRLDGGTPTASSGMLLGTADGERFYERFGDVADYRFIVASGTVSGTLTATYFMVR